MVGTAVNVRFEPAQILELGALIEMLGEADELIVSPNLFEKAILLVAHKFELENTH